LCVTAISGGGGLKWVKTGKSRSDQMFSGLPPKADLTPLRQLFEPCVGVARYAAGGGGGGFGGLGGGGFGGFGGNMSNLLPPMAAPAAA
jgi:hypothetical protein